MRLLHQLACDLDELTATLSLEEKRGGTRDEHPNPSGERYRNRYRQVLAEAVARDVPEMGGVVPEAETDPEQGP
jgi:hypothetical protein